MRALAWHRVRPLVAFAAILLLGACAARPPSHEGYPEPVFDHDRIVPEALRDEPSKVYDPWYGLNRRIYDFNQRFDRYLLLPVVRGYQWILPDFAEQGVSNFFDNIRDASTALNSLLQLKPEKAAQATGRVLANSSLGLLGTIDVATRLRFPQPLEDFGQTLGHWGVGTGPYLVLPLLGPSNLRDGLGRVPDLYLPNALYSATLPSPERSFIFPLNSADTRSRVPFRYYETNMAFEYETVRWLITTKRELDVRK